jgi:hypothetical protein
MACDLETIQSEACTSGIGKVQDRIALLQIIAQLTCEASSSIGEPVIIDNISLDSNFVFSQDHGLAGAPSLVRFVVRFTESVSGFTEGLEIDPSVIYNTGDANDRSYRFAWSADATKVWAWWYEQSINWPTFSLPSSTGIGTTVDISLADLPKLVGKFYIWP